MEIGDLIDGKYRIESVLGQGGMGRVLAASHVDLGTSVAIKILLPAAAQHPDMAHRFMREARAASRLRSDHVCRVIDVGRLPDGAPYMVMERLHGSDLAREVQLNGPMPVAKASGYILQALEALAEAHSHGMIHRDLKPANIFITQRLDGSPLVKVLDFGIATAGTGESSFNLTSTETMIGSPAYMSPEQMRSARSVDMRSDVWALGVSLYELVSATYPFQGDSIIAISIKIATEPHPPLTNVPAAFARVVDRCLVKDPARRYQNVSELAQALAPFAADGAAAAARVTSALRVRAPAPETDVAFAATIPPSGVQSTLGASVGEPAPPTPSRRPSLMAVAAIGIGVAAAGIGVYTLGMKDPPARVEGAAAPGSSVPSLPAVFAVDAAPPDAAAPDAGVVDAAAAVPEPDDPRRGSSGRKPRRTVDAGAPPAVVTPPTQPVPIDAGAPRSTVDAGLFENR